MPRKLSHQGSESYLSRSISEASLSIGFFLFLCVLVCCLCTCTGYYFWKRHQRQLAQVEDEEGDYVENLEELRQVTIVPIRPKVNVSVLTQQPSFYSVNEEFMPPWNPKTNEQQMIWNAPFSTESEDHFPSSVHYAPVNSNPRSFRIDQEERKDIAETIANINRLNSVSSGDHSDDGLLNSHGNELRMSRDEEHVVPLSVEDLEFALPTVPTIPTIPTIGQHSTRESFVEILQSKKKNRLNGQL